MTQKVNPSPQRPASSFKTAGAIAYGGGSEDGYVVPSNETTEIAIQDQGIDASGINQFNQISSSSTLNVSIDGGEAFVFGAWVCIDTTTSITLAEDTPDQTVFVGWNKNAADNVIIGTASTFSVTPGDTDQKIPLYTFDTDSNGVVDVVDERFFEQISADSIEQGSGSSLDADTVDGIEASELGSDVSNDGTTVTSSSTDLDFTDNITASDDGDGTSTISVDDSFVKNTGDTILGDVSFEDNLRLLFGSDSDFSIQYVDSDNELKIIDETNDVVKMVFDKNGDVFIPNGDLDLGGTNTVTNLSEPSNNTDAATKQFTESVAQGLDIKEAVRVCTCGQGNIDLSSSTDPNPIDTVTLNDGDRILLIEQTDATENGIYEAVDADDPTTWVRTTDANDDVDINTGMFVLSVGGSESGNVGFVLITPNPIDVGVTPLNFTRFSGAEAIEAGDNISRTGSRLDIVDGSGSGLDADTVDGIEASNLSPDVSDDETTVTNSTTDLNFSSNLGASDDGDGTSTIFVDISDDETVALGSDNDISQRYDSSNDSLQIKDEKNNIDRLEFERTTGNLSILGELTENASL